MLDGDKKNILIFFPYNQRTVEQQSVIELLQKKGHQVFLLTLLGEDFLHEFVKKMGVMATSTHTGLNLSFRNILSNAKQVIKFCRNHNIHIVFAHQQLCMLPLILAQPFIKTTNYYFRHNTDEGYKDFPIKLRLLNKFVNTFSRNIVAPSDIVYKFLLQEEKVPISKLLRVDYGYNFNQYEKPITHVVESIKKKYACRFLILSIARLVPSKRHIIMFDVVKKLVSQGKDVKFLCLGGGSSKKEYSEWIALNGMKNNIFLLGIMPNIFDYLSAADLLIHLSETEASNSVIKEAALAYKPVIVCNNVGDFGDYIINEQNGFLVNKENPFSGTIQIIESYYDNKEQLSQLGEQFHKTVTDKFRIENVEATYQKLIYNEKY